MRTVTKRDLHTGRTEHRYTDIPILQGRKRRVISKYWGKKNALQKEAWAQFGRVMYSNAPDVLKMFENLFTSFNESAIIALKDVI